MFCAKKPPQMSKAIASFKLFIAAAWAVLGVGTASATDVSTAIQLPEASRLLGWYGNLSNGAPVFRDGLIFEASIGYAFSDGFRLEGELSHGRDAIDELLAADAGLASDQADTGYFALMVNGAYDFDTHTPLTPFIGAGLGGVRVHYDDLALLGDDLNFSTEESGWKFGVQGFAGVEYEFTPDLRLGVRYTHKLVSNLGDSFDNAAAIETPEANSLRSRVFLLTLTYEFGGP
jgi:opacity protein-like surface antigen